MKQLSRRVLVLIASVFFLSAAITTWSQSMTGSISGVVTDSSGAVIPGATVTATAQATSVKNTTVSDGKGFFSFPALNVGKYDVSSTQAGFSNFVDRGVTIDANSAVRVDISMKIGAVNDVVNVESDVLQVETQNTAMGEVIGEQQVAAMPLNGRSFIDLLSLQPGVSPYQTGKGGTSKTTGAGLSETGVSGDLTDGTQSVNGGRTGANGFMVNGGDAQEGVHNGAALIPNLDSVAEFRIITNNFDAEYGNYSGGQINVVTKSGSNKFHGGLFDFLRNTDLDAKTYFTPARGVYIQNQFGGTFGGPIKKDKVFFFGDYQGTRQIIGAAKSFNVPSNADRGGDLTDQESDLGGTVVGANWANILSNKLGYPVANHEAYYFTGCTQANCVFPGAQIPTSAFDVVAKNTLKYIPTANVGSDFFSTAAYPATLSDNKYGIRGDANTRFGEAFVYFYHDKYNGVNPYTGVPVPGFSEGNIGETMFGDIGLTSTISKSTVNDVRIVYTRVTGTNGSMIGGKGVKLSDLGFVTPWSSAAGPSGPGVGGIDNVDPNNIGVPRFSFSNFSFGSSTSIQTGINNTVQFLDNWTKVIGTHTIQAGGEFHYDQINQRHPSTPNGSFSFDGTETGVDFADYLIGSPDGFSQQSFQILDTRDLYYGAYAQDSWRATPTLTLNYGLRWEVSTPWYDTSNKLEAFAPGHQSQAFPTSPEGQVEPLDPGIPRTLVPIQYHNFAPRIGIAYSPAGTSGALGKLFGGAGKTSIRVGYGVFYQGIEDATSYFESGDAPYGQDWAAPNAPLMDRPYVDRASGNFEGVKFPFEFPPKNVSPAHPFTNFDWSAVEPISGSEFYDIRNPHTPYSQQLEFSVQRQFGGATVASLSYVGTVANHLLTGLESNPGNPALCLFMDDPANLQTGQATCGPKQEENQYFEADGTVVNTTRPYSYLDTRNNPNNVQFGFGSNAYYSPVGHSMYNSLQGVLKNQTKYGNFLVSYTYSKAMDNGSDVFDSTYVFNPKFAWALSTFDLRHDVSTSYTVNLPFDKWAHASGGAVQRIAGGWQLSGHSTFASGQPVQLTEGDDRDLIGDSAFRFSTPSVAGLGNGLFQGASNNPRTGKPYFNNKIYHPVTSIYPSTITPTSTGYGPCGDTNGTSSLNPDGYFMVNPCGTVGNAKRRFFAGPGLDNYDMSLLKNTKITEGSSLQFRAEAFNVFNHAQFNNPQGSATSGAFGKVTTALDPRIMQIALKLEF